VAGHLPHQISGGQRSARLWRARWSNQPTALLLDEPFAALDKALRQRLPAVTEGPAAQLRLPDAADHDTTTTTCVCWQTRWCTARRRVVKALR